MTDYFVHGQSMGDTLYTAQRWYYHEPVTWVTDLYNKPIIDWLNKETDCPIPPMVYLKSDHTYEYDKPKFLPYYFWREPQWKASGLVFLSSADSFKVHRPSLSGRGHVAEQAIDGKGAVRNIRSSTKLNPKKKIAVLTETWKPARKFFSWDKLVFKPGYEVFEIINIDCSNQDKYPKIRSESIEQTVELLSECDLVVSIASMPAALSACLGIPTIMLHESEARKGSVGVEVFGGKDLLVANSPEDVNIMIESMLN